MNTVRFAMRSIACIAFLLFPLTLLAQSAARPDWKVGDTWTLKFNTTAGVGASAAKEETRVVKEATDAGYKWEVTIKTDGPVIPAEIRTYSRDLNSLEVVGSGDPQEYKWLQWPLEVGKTYSFDIAFGGGQVAKWSGKVAALEDVEVPAGKFKAYRIEFERGGSFRSAASDTFWYAPDAKVFVKRVSKRANNVRSYDTTETLLTAYKLN